MASKKISEMTDDELLAAIEELRSVPVPNAPGAPRRPKRMDEAKPRKRASVFDQLDE